MLYVMGMQTITCGTHTVTPEYDEYLAMKMQKDS
jgi:hypothetical protein